MPLGPLISDEVRMLAAKLHQEHPKWTNAMIRNEIRAILHKNDESLPPDKRYPKDWPSKYAIDRIMPDIRERAKRSKFERNPIDQPWTIQSLVKYPLPAEALPSVLKVWLYAKSAVRTFTIRDARWAGRLYTVITDIEDLFGYSFHASVAELWAERAGIEDFVGHEIVNLYVLSTMTGHVISTKMAKKIVGISGEIRPKTMYGDPWFKPMIDADVPKGAWDGLVDKTSGEVKPRRKGGTK